MGKLRKRLARERNVRINRETLEEITAIREQQLKEKASRASEQRLAQEKIELARKQEAKAKAEAKKEAEAAKKKAAEAKKKKAVQKSDSSD